MEFDSPLNTQLLKKHRRRVISSSDDDPDPPLRTEEVQDHIPCDFSPPACANGGSSGSSDHEVVIEFTHSDCCDDSPWQTEDDSFVSSTSTPEFKRGIHKQHGNNDTEEQNRHIVKQICQEGLEHAIPHWIARRQARRNRPSVLILTDGLLQHWSAKDRVCEVIHHQGWPIRRWSQAIHSGQIVINHRNVVCYLEATCNWNDIPPLKNCLHGLGKAIRSCADDNPRIFVSNLLNPARNSPVWKPNVVTNFTLQQATRSVG